MKVNLKILFIATLCAASAFATRADDIADLVAFIAGSTTEKRIVNDVKTSALGADKPRYASKSESNSEDFRLIDGILNAMKRQQSAMHSNRRVLYSRPTLGRQDFFRPVPGIITSDFGWRPQFQRIHHGVDLSLNIGDTVRAAVTGTVTKIAYDHDGYGHYVVMHHDDGMETVYGHLEYALVGQGQLVFAGQPIGIGGNTGNSTGPHLHFEARLGGVAIDPTLIFDFYGYYRYFQEENHNNAVPKDPVYSHQTKSLAKESTYIVRYGDTLQSIARQAGISVMKLCQLNMLEQSSPPPVGRMLKLK